MLLKKSNIPIKVVLLILWLLFSTFSMLNHTLAEYFTLFSYIGFFVIGKYLYDYTKNHNMKKYNVLLIVLMIFLFIISIILNYKSSLKYNMFYNLYFAYRTPFIMFPSFAFYILLITNFQKQKMNKGILLLSDLSLGVYLIHGIFLDITVKKFIYQAIPSIVGIPLFTGIIFIGSIVFSYVIGKIKFLKNIIK